MNNLANPNDPVTLINPVIIMAMVPEKTISMPNNPNNPYDTCNPRSRYYGYRHWKDYWHDDRLSVLQKEW